MVSFFSNFSLAAGIINIAYLRSLQKDLMQRVVFTVEASAKRETPVLTGNLRRSVTGAVVGVTQGIIGSNLIYAPIVHRRNPYLDRGYTNASGQIDNLFEGFAAAVVSK